MYDRMIHDHGYSVRKLAEKLGKDKGYLENRLRLADAPEEIRELVSLRKDTLSHAYELMKVDDPKKRRRLAGQVAPRRADAGQAAREDRGSPAAVRGGPDGTSRARIATSTDPRLRRRASRLDRRRPDQPRSGDDSLVNAQHQLSDAVEDLVVVSGRRTSSAASARSTGPTSRST